MLGYRFSKYINKTGLKRPFDNLLDLFKQLIVITSGDVAETLSWMNELDRQHKMTPKDYGMGDFIEDLKKKGYITEDNESGEYKLKSKCEVEFSISEMEDFFGIL